MYVYCSTYFIGEFFNNGNHKILVHPLEQHQQSESATKMNN